MRREYLILGASILGAASAGFFGGYKYAQQKLLQEFSDDLTEEIRKTKEFYSNFYKEQYPTPADAVNALGVEVQEATVALQRYNGVEIKPEDLENQSFNIVNTDVEVEVEERNIFEEDSPLTIHKENRDHSKPYVVTLDEYMDHPEGFDEVQLTWYAGDGILGDDQDEPVPAHEVENLVGSLNLMLFGASDPDDPNILLIRNEKKELDIEVTHSDGKFSHEVAGFVQHSDEPMRRTRQRWDDE